MRNFYREILAKFGDFKEFLSKFKMKVKFLSGNFGKFVG